MTEEAKQEQEERYSRIRRLKRLLRPLPRRATIHRYPVLKFFASAARKKSYLWSFRMRQVTPAFYAGAILALLPAYGAQIALAFFAAILFRANLPIVVALQFLTNPLTLAPIYLFTYKVGSLVLRWVGLHETTSAVISVPVALTLGGIITGTVLAFFLDLAYRNLAGLKSLRDKKKSHSPLPTD